MPESPPTEGQPFVVNDSNTLAIIKTSLILLGFASTTLVTVIRMLNARQFVELWVFLQREDIVAGLAGLASAALLIWRLIRAHLRTERDKKIVAETPASVALLRSEVKALPAPTRARETTAAPGVRVLDRSALRGASAPFIVSDEVDDYRYDPGAQIPVLKPGDRIDVLPVAAKRSDDFDQMMADPAIAQFLGNPHAEFNGFNEEVRAPRPGDEFPINHYSSNGVDWHDKPLPDDTYLRVSVDGGATWRAPMRYNVPQVMTQFSAELAGPWTEMPPKTGAIYIRTSMNDGVTWSEPQKIVGEIVGIAPQIPGDALSHDAARQDSAWQRRRHPANTPAFNAAYDAFHTLPRAEREAFADFPAYLEANGWFWGGDRWKQKVGEA